MRLPSCSVRVILATLLALPMAASCGSKQTAPTPTPTATTLAVSCDATSLSAIGQQARCQARLTLSDASTQDQTAAAQWSSSDPGKVAVTAGGQIAAAGIGSADIAAVFSGITARQTITVSAACEFSVSPQALSFADSGGSQAVAVTAAPAGCSPAGWNAASNDAALTVSPSSGSGGGTVTITAAENNGAARTVTATIAGKTVTAGLAAEPPPPAKPTHALNLTLLEGEQLSGPYGGFVTGPNGFSCTLSGSRTSCPPLSFEDGTRVELVVTLTTGAALGTPIRSATGCDSRTRSTCTVMINGDRNVSIAIGCEVFCEPPADQFAANALERFERRRPEARVRQQLY